MKTARVLKRMSKRLKRAVAVYENGEATLGRRVDEHDEILSILIDTVSDLCGIIAALEVREKALRKALGAASGSTN